MKPPANIDTVAALEILGKRFRMIERGDIRNIRYEPLEMGALVVVSVYLVEGVDAAAAEEVCEQVGALIESIWPPREDEYSWTVVVRSDELVRTALSGGWLGLTTPRPA